MQIIWGFSFILGVVIGSFLNVCIYRWPNGQSVIKPRSACGHCHSTLRSKDLIPLFSWLFLKGKCAFCSAKISIRYPFVELLTGVGFLLSIYRFGFSIETLALWFFTCFAITVAFIDLDHRKIYNKSVWIGLLFAIVYQLSSYYFVQDLGLIKDAVLGMSLSFFVMLLLAWVSRLLAGDIGMGYGDVKIYLALGFLLGLKSVLISIWLMFLIAGVIALFLLLTASKTMMKKTIPLGPMIMISGWIMFFLK